MLWLKKNRQLIHAHIWLYRSISMRKNLFIFHWHKNIPKGMFATNMNINMKQIRNKALENSD